MKIIIIFFTLIILFLQLGCGTNKFTTLNNSSDCITTIEGNFTTPKAYKHFAPAVLFKKGSKYNYKLGTVVDQNENGVFLLEKDYSFLQTPDTLFFEYSIIRAIIDSNYFCVYGDIDKNESKKISLSFYLEKVGDPDYSPIYMELVSNEKFAYCVQPGEYRLTKIVQEIYGNDDYFYESFPVFDFTINALANRANYIGDINLLTAENKREQTIAIPYFKQMNSGNAGAAFGLIGGAIGGAVAGAIVGLTNEAWKDEIRGYYFFSIMHSESYKSLSKSELNNCQARFILKY